MMDQKPKRLWVRLLFGFAALVVTVVTSGFLWPFLEKLAEEQGAFEHPTSRVLQVFGFVISAVAATVAFLARHYGALLTFACGGLVGMALGVVKAKALRRLFHIGQRLYGRQADKTDETKLLVSALKEEAVRLAGADPDGVVLLETLLASTVLPAGATDLHRKSLVLMASEELLEEGLATDPTGRGELLQLSPDGVTRSRALYDLIADSA